MRKKVGEKSVGGTHQRRSNPASRAVTDRRVHRQYALGQQQLHRLAMVSDASLPVLGCLAAAHVLKLVGREPGILEKDARPLGSLTQSRQVQETLVAPAFHLEDHFSVPIHVPAFLANERGQGPVSGRRAFRFARLRGGTPHSPSAPA